MAGYQAKLADCQEKKKISIMETNDYKQSSKTYFILTSKISQNVF